MSFKSILGNLGTINLEDIKVRNKLTFAEDNYTVDAVLNPSNGNFFIQHASHSKPILAVNSAGVLQSSLLTDATGELWTSVNGHTNQLIGHDGRLSSLENSTMPYTTQQGNTVNGSPEVVASVGIANDTSGAVYGFLTADTCNIQYNLFVSNVSGTVVIHSWNLDINYAGGNEDLTFQVNGTSVDIYFQNRTAGGDYTLSYASTFN